MSSSKTSLLAWLGLVTLLAASAPAFAGWSADFKRSWTTVIPEIHLSGLRAYRGRNLSVFYVSGREPSISVAGRVLKVRSIKADPVTIRIDDSGQVIVPRIEVRRTGFSILNYVVFAIHQQDTLYLRNPDGTYPLDPRVPDGDFSRVRDSDYNYDRIEFVGVGRLRALKVIAPQVDYVTLDFNDLN